MVIKRKLGGPVPDVLHIQDGAIVLENGLGPDAYLRDWQSKYKVSDGTKVCIITRDSLERMEEQLALLMACSFC